MSYEVHATLPDLANVEWTGATPPPAIGAAIVATINGCGPAIVTGYFTQEGYLGVLCDLLAPPAWHVRQNKGNPRGHLFGPECKPAETAHDVSTEFGRACFARDWLEARERTAAAALGAVPGIGSGAMGLTPDDVKAEETYRRAKACHVAAFDRLRDFNRTFTKTFKSELAAQRAATRGAKRAAQRREFFEDVYILPEAYSPDLGI
ncbi:hypothetical protein [Sphingomonas sp. 3-13AW]|uniref:hypothetical protein n=1 Tax=Sphingomonas sp. 3-13AW TaxID=3050450 RepID=UPI003BB6AE0E